MASKYSIEAVFKLIDNISSPLDRIAGKGNRVGKALKNDFMAAQRSLDRMGQTLATVGKLAIGAGVAAVGAGIAVATHQFIEFDAAATAATAKFKDLDVTSDTYAESLKKVGQTARDVAAVTEYNAVDTAGALDKMAMAGLTSEQSMKLLMGTTNLATAAGMDLTTAVDIATDSLGAFGLMTDDAAQLSTNLDRVSDVMARTTNMFNTDMPGMFEAIKKGGPAFTSAGQSVEDFSALIGAMASSGVKGSEAGTQLRNMMLSLAKPSDAAAKTMERMGIAVQDQDGNFLNVIDIIGQFERATASMGSAEKAAALATIFGSRTVTGMNILLQEGSERLRGYRTELENAGGAAANIAGAMRGSIKNKIEVLKSALTELGFKFVEAFQAKGVGLIEKLTEAISQFDPAPIISAFTTVASIIGSVIGAIWNMREIILGVAIAWGIYKTAMLAAVVIGPILGFVKAVQTLMAAQKGMNAVQAIFNVLLNMNPIGLIITAIGVLIGLVILAVTHWKEIIAVLSYAWEWIKYVGLVIWDSLCGAFSALAGFISENSEKIRSFIAIFTGPFGFVISMVYELVDSWDMVVNTFKTDGIIAGLKRLGGVLVSGLLAPVQGFLEMLSKIPIIGEKIAPAASRIADFRAELKGYENETEAAAASGVAAASRAAGGPRPVRQAPGKLEMPTENTDPAPAASGQAGTASAATTTAPATSPAGASTAPGTGGAASPVSGGMTQPALLNLRTGTSPAPAAMSGGASPWLAEAAVTSGDEDIVSPAITAAPALTRTVSAGVSPAPATRTATGTPAASGPVRVPVEYVFPEMVIPADIIKSITIPVEFALPPRRAGPLPLAGPVSGAVGQGITPPEAPMTQAEQIVYSRIDNYENVKIEVSPEGGTSARIITPPRSPHVELLVSGDA